MYVRIYESNTSFYVGKWNLSIKKIFVLKSEYLFLNILGNALSNTVAIKFKLNIK